MRFREFMRLKEDDVVINRANGDAYVLARNPFLSGDGSAWLIKARGPENVYQNFRCKEVSLGIRR